MLKKYQDKKKTKTILCCLNHIPVDKRTYGIFVVVQFYPWFKFYLPLFLVYMVMHANKFQTEGSKILNQG